MSLAEVEVSKAIAHPLSIIVVAEILGEFRIEFYDGVVRKIKSAMGTFDSPWEFGSNVWCVVHKGP